MFPSKLSGIFVSILQRAGGGWSGEQRISLNDELFDLRKDCIKAKDMYERALKTAHPGEPLWGRSLRSGRDPL